MKKSDLKKIKEGSYIYNGIHEYEVTKVDKSEVKCCREWENDWGKFGYACFVSYEELLEDYWEVIE